jgi:hypothetical protein
VNPMVTVIVTHHLDENQKYLDLCLENLLKSERFEYGYGFINIETIVLSDAPTCPNVPDGVTLVHNRDLNTATKKGHFGIAMASPDTKYFLFLSDDVVLHRWTIMHLVQDVGDNAWICNPMSNSDNGSRFISPTHPGPDLELEDFVECVPSICSDDAEHGETLLIRQDWVSFFCTLMPRAVWERVGPLDERLEVRGNDVDYCLRAAALGIPTFINFRAFAFHFGSKTLKKTVSPEQYAEADQAFRTKWSER